LKDREEKAEKIFSSGFNCSQGVFTAFAVDEGMEEAVALRLSTPFGGGVGGCGETCGAVSGAYMVIGLKHGRASLDDAEAKEVVYSIMAEFRKKFSEEFGSLKCSELVGVDMGNYEERSKAREQGRLERCKDFVRGAVRILEDIA
jgi:C_GCAxxG_C_C family probable redox protein